jgi:peptidyl-prolyl cis-trans isomerase SurA
MKHVVFALLSTSILLGSYSAACAKEHSKSADKAQTLASSPKEAAPAAPKGDVNRIVAIVNSDIISSKDMDDRIALVIATTGMNDAPEIRQKLKAQIIRGLIDEKLQTQAAARLNLTISDTDVQQAIAGIEKNRNKPAGSLKGFLINRGLSTASFEDQIRAQILWNKLISRKIAPSITITDDEISEEQHRMVRDEAKQPEYKIASFLLPVMRPEDAEPTQKLAEKLVGEIQSGANFEAIAGQMSAVGGKQLSPQWVKASRLDTYLKKALEDMGDKGISTPIKTPAGYQIIQLLEKKSFNKTSDAEVALKQLILTLRDDAENKEVDVLMNIARAIAKNPGTCEEKTLAGIESFEGLNADISQIRMKLSDMSPSMRPFVEPLAIGGISDPFAAPDGIHLLMLCERTVLPEAGGDKNKAKELLFDDKIQLATMKYLRDLRREAYVDIRLR